MAKTFSLNADEHVLNVPLGDVKRRARRGYRYRTDLAPWRRLAYPRQADLANELGATRGYVSFLESGLVLPNRLEAMRIADLLSLRLGFTLMLGLLWPSEDLCRFLNQQGAR